MKKKVIMRKNRKKMNTIKLLTKKFGNVLQLPVDLHNYSVEDIEKSGKECLKNSKHKNNRIKLIRSEHNEDK